MQNELEVVDQHRSILCRLSALKSELSRVSEIHPELALSAKPEGISEKQRGILKIIKALKEEVNRIAELQERRELKVSKTIYYLGMLYDIKLNWLYDAAKETSFLY